MRRLAVVLVVIWLLSVAASAPQLYEYSLYTYVELEDGENHTEVGKSCRECMAKLRVESSKKKKE